jgi:hypothetical protein
MRKGATILAVLLIANEIRGVVVVGSILMAWWSN